jgi:hypothetical protein
MNAQVRASTIDPLLHPRDAAKLLAVSTSWLAKARLSGKLDRGSLGQCCQPSQKDDGEGPEASPPRSGQGRRHGSVGNRNRDFRLRPHQA